MIVSVWHYRVAEGREAEFESLYGAGGEWAELFGKGTGYLGTELMRGEGGNYVIMDTWRDRAAFDAFKKKFEKEYAALDRRCEELTVEEQALGFYEAV